MKRKFFAIASGLIESGGGIVVSAIWQNLLWLGFTLIGIGIISITLGFTWNHSFKYLKWLKSKLLLVLAVITRINEAEGLLIVKDEQKKNPEQWLYPVIEYIDLNRQGSAHDDNNVYVRFQIDSHLLFPINEFYVFVKLCLYDTVSFQEIESAWHEIPLPEHHAPINTLERHDFSENVVHLGESNEEKEKKEFLLEIMGRFRNGHPILAMIKIGVKFQKDDNLNLLERNGPKHITPANDYRGV